MKTLQQQATEMLETIDSVGGEKKYARLTPSDRALIFRLAAKGNITQAEIAKAVGCDPSTVTRTLQLLDTRSEARTILESGAARLADTVVNTADAGIALKALGKLDVVREETTPAGPQVVIVLGGDRDPFQDRAVPPDPTDA